MEKMNRPWTGKKNSIANPQRKEQHSNRKNKKHLLYLQEEREWELQVKDFHIDEEIFRNVR